MFKIGNLEIEHRAIPAPMASFTDIAFRKLMDEIGYTGFMVTELISAEGIRRRQDRTLQMLQGFDYKTPQLVQIFGDDPEAFVEAARFIENETNFSGIDLNMGCPAPKIIRKGAGAALLREPQKVASIVRAVRSSVTLPLTVKIRLGFNDVNVFEIVDILSGEGVDAIAVHFRLKADRYLGQAKWEYAAQIRERFEGIFIGNGDLLHASEVREKLEIVDAVMIGRGAIRNPLIFAEIAGVDLGEIDLQWCVDRLIELIIQYYPPKLQLPRIKGFARFLFFGRRGCKKIRNEVYTAKTLEAVCDLLKDLDLGEDVTGISGLGGPS